MLPFFQVKYLLRLVICFFFTAAYLLIITESVFSQTIEPANSRYMVLNPLGGVRAQCMLQDKFQFMWLGTYMGLYRFDGYATQLVTTSEKEAIQLSDKNILSLYEDSDTNLWVGTENGINFINSSRTKVKQYLVEKNFYLNGKNSINTVTEDRNGTIWCGSQKGFLYAIKDNKEVQSVANTLGLYPDKLFSPITKITPNKEGNLWVATLYRGVYLVSTKGEILEHYPIENVETFALEKNGHSPVFIQERNLLIYNYQQKHFVSALASQVQEKPWLGRRILLKEDQYVWLAYNFKLFRWHIQSNVLEDFSALYMGTQHLDVYNMYQDDNHNYWLSTASGIIVLSSRENCFTVLSPPQAIKDGYFSTRNIVEDDNNKLYIGSYQGFFEYDLQEQSFKEHLFKFGNDLVNPIVRAIAKDSAGNLWLGSEGYGLLHFETRTHKFTPVKVNHSSIDSANPGLNSATHIITLLKDQRNCLWVGTYNGLFVLTKPGGQLQPYANAGSMVDLQTLTIRHIYQSRDQSIWLATNGGLFKIVHDQGIVAHYTSDLHSGKTSLSTNYINCIYEDEEGYLWLGTKGGGVNKLHPEKGVTEVYTINNGLASDEVYAILPGENKELWITTLNGLSRLDVTQNNFRNFFTKDGLPGNEFNQGSVLRAKNNRLYLGGVNGIVSFLPNDIVKEKPKPHIKLIKLLKHNGTLNQTDETSLPIATLKKINLHYKDKFFIVHFALANYFETAKCQFAYKLEGVTNDWQYIGSNNFIQFTGLPAGDYVLHVKGAGNDGVWVSEPLKISIHIGKAFYATLWAYLLYACLLAFTIFLVVRFQWKRIQMQNELKLEHLHSQKLAELNRMKSQFFTNIAHEFRTPLTLILGPAEQLYADTRESRHKNWANSIKRNSTHLLGLIDQLLDLSKLEAGTEKLNLTYQDIISFIQDNTYAIQSLADQQSLSLSFETSLPELKMSFDPVKLQKILYNLLSNSCKFTPAAGSVKVSMQPVHSTGDETLLHYIELKVTDTGIGISEEHLPFIFDRYYQVSNPRSHKFSGTGIGLALVKELLELHQAKIWVESTPGKGTCFTIHLPVVNQGFPFEGKIIVKDTSQEDILKLIRQPKEAPCENSSITPAAVEPDRQVILVVDDHEGVRQFICESLSPYYQVISAENGVEGLKLAKETIPDIVISDVMMPHMDGHTFLHLLKHAEHTSHIPVVLLTAKSSQENRIEGLKTGADLYLVKPFHVQELLLSIRNILYLREQIHKQLAASPSPATPISLCNGVDQSFLERFTSIVDTHLSDDNFGVEEMVIQIGISRTQLHRKVKAVTGESTSHLIRTIRLQRAIDMLKNNALSISEIAYQVGFSSPSYFTESFTKHFGHPPNEARKVKA